MLSKQHIAFIIKDLNYRGIVLEGFQYEVIDHVCCAVEEKMARGANFVEAYRYVVATFGDTEGLRDTQQKTIEYENKTATIMFRNYLTIALRNLRKQRFFALINVFGLAIGIAACLVIVLLVVHELSYDRYNTNAERIVRLNTEIKFGENHFHMASGNAVMAELLPQSFPEVEKVVRFRSWGKRMVHRPESTDQARENTVWADSTVFSVFSIQVLQGDSRSALREPNSVAISKKMADKYFPNGNALGQTLILDRDWAHKVTAVYTDIPDASHFHFDLMVAMTGLEESKSVTLVSGGDFNIYILMRPGSDAKALEAKFPAFVEKHVGPQIAAVIGGDFTMEKFRASGNIWEYTLTPLLDIHLRSALMDEIESNGNITYVYLFSVIALFILLIACINFMNMSTARSANRAREVGIRKVMGSLRSHLVRQFLTEAFLLTSIAFIIALALAYFFLPVFNTLAERDLQVPFGSPLFYCVVIVAAILVGALSGLYPSFFLSAFQPANVLKGKISLGMKSGSVRSALVVFQFVISIFLIIGTLTVYRQLKFIQTKNLGFDRDQVIVVKETSILGNNLEAFRNEVLKSSSISGATISSYLPVDGSWRSSDTFWKEGQQPTQENIDQMVSLQKWAVDYDYINTLGMKIRKGRGFSREFPSDSSAVVVNQAAVKKFNFEDPIGQKISTFSEQNADGTPDRTKMRSWTIVGVLDDFHFESMKNNITPLGLFLEPSNSNVIVRFQASNTALVIQSLEKAWKDLSPGQAFSYSFLDDDFGRMYSAERRFGQIFFLFSCLAIVIACLGLFALTAFTAEQRTKEIGIRKVLGASVFSIIYLMSREFGKLIAIAFIVTVPAAWFSVRWWLATYSYRAPIGWELYAAAGMLAFVITIMTMAYQSVRAATANPVKALRTE